MQSPGGRGLICCGGVAESVLTNNTGPFCGAAGVETCHWSSVVGFLRVPSGEK